MKRQLVVAAWVVGWASVAWAGSGGLERCAVLCPPEMREAGLEERLIAEVRKSPGVQLLERRQLERAIGELTLEQVFGSEQAGNRLKLGRLLPADALLIVRQGVDGAIQMLVSECRQGVRLHLQDFAGEEELLQQVLPLVQSLRQRYPQGLKHVFAVSHFISRNLVHDYDAFQKGYPRVLAASLMLQPGVAVVETEEARAIARELAIAGEGLASPAIPLLVEGEFRMESVKAQTQVRLSIQLRGSRQRQAMESGALALANAPRWLAENLAGQVLREAQEGKELAVSAVCDALARQAEGFSRIGAYEHAANLREAIVLLDGGRVDQRILLVEDYLRAAAPRILPPHRTTLSYHDQIKPTMRVRTDAYVAGIDHLEHLIRKGQIDFDQALKLGSQARPSTVVGGSFAWYGSLMEEEAARAQQAGQRFMVEAFAMTLSLGGSPTTQPADGHKALNEWQETMLLTFAHRADSRYATKQDLDLYRHVLEEIVPDGLELRSDLLPPLCISPRGWAAAQEEYREFLVALSESSHRSASLLGRYALLQLRLQRASLGGQSQQNQLEEMLRLRQEVHLLLEDCLRLPYPDGHTSNRESEPIVKALTWRCDWIDRSIDTALARPPSEPEANGSPSTRPFRRRPPDAVRLQSVGQIQIRRLDGSMTPFSARATSPGHRAEDGPIRFDPEGPMPSRALEGLNPVRCGNGLDIYWNSHRLLFMHRPGLMKEILFVPQESIHSVVWDGRYVWVGRLDAGIQVFDTNGRLAAMIGHTEHLPPVDLGLLLHPLEPGRVIAVGCFGDQRRRWCATVRWSDDRHASVDVFHEAVNAPVADEKRAKDLKDDAHAAAGLQWLHAYPSKGADDRPILLVSRGSLRPLQIDLRTLAVSVFPIEPPKHGPFPASVDGVLVTLDQSEERFSQVRVVAPPGENWPDGRRSKPIPVANSAGPDSSAGMETRR